MDEQSLATIDYLGAFQYQDDALDFLSTAEGYVKAVHTGETTEYHYVYNYIDHLGNIRLSYGRDPETGEIAILKENHYYPFGLEHQGYVGTHKTIGIGIDKVSLIPVRNYLDDSYRYTFGSKEEQPELGLNWMDFHARNYMPDLGRWMSPDPLAEEYSSWSPYNYVMNSPLRFTDPTGMFIEPPTKPGEFEGDVHFDEDTGASYEWDGKGGWHSDLQGGEELDEVYITNETPSSGEGSSNGEAENSSSDIFNTTIGALGFSTGIKNELVGFASKSGELSSGTMKYLKYSQGLGHGMTATNVIMSHIVYDKSNKQLGDKAKLGVSYTATTLTLFGKTAPIGIGIGIVDFSGGFDGFYNHLNQQEKLYHSTGGIVVPTNGVPIFIKFKNN